MALITQTAMRNETFRSIARLGQATIHVNERGDIVVGRSRVILQEGSPYYYDNIIGVKSGTTTAAGNCFVGAAERDGATIISVAFKAPEDMQRYTDTQRLFDYGWTCYDAYTIDEMYEIAGPRIVNLVISNAASDDPEGGRLNLEVAQISNSNYLRMVERGNEQALEDAVNDFISRTQLQVPHNLTAPISKGEIIGDFQYYDPSGSGTVTAKLIAGRDVAERTVLATLTDYLPFLRVFQNRLVLVLLFVLGLLLALIVALVATQRAAKQRRRQRIYDRRRSEYLRRRLLEQQDRSRAGMSPRDRDERRPRR